MVEPVSGGCVINGAHPVVVYLSVSQNMCMFIPSSAISISVVLSPNTNNVISTSVVLSPTFKQGEGGAKK